MIKLITLPLLILVLGGCSSSDGTNGLNSMVTVTDEAAGANCPYGGQSIEIGSDNNTNGSLDESEIDSTTYVCNGVDALTNLILTTTEPVGAQCINGGTKIESGLDYDDNGSLDTSEVDTTTYVCSAGLKSDLTPSTGTLVETDAPAYGNKGYRFTAIAGFTIIGAEWFFTLPADGIVRANVYDSTGILVAQGSNAVGDGTEAWYRSNVNYNFVEGQEYTVSFYTNRSTSSLFDRKSSPTYGYTVDGLISNITHYAEGISTQDIDTEAFPINNNTWAPFQRLLIQ